MPTFGIAPRAMLAKKPKHGAPCNQCGLCCAMTLCPLASFIFGDWHGACPALQFDSELNSKCGLVAESEDKFAAAAKTIIGAGCGCDARFNGELPDVGFYLTLAKWDHDHADEINEAKKIWGVP